MDIKLIKLAQEWGDFRKQFVEMCSKDEELNKQIQQGWVVHSGDKDDLKKSQLILAFIEKPINTYRDERGVLRVETEWGCRLFYTYQYNGSVICKVKGYDGIDYFPKYYKSSSKINEREFRKHIENFFLVETCTSATKQPSRYEFAKFQLLTKVSNMSFVEIMNVLIKAIPIIGKAYKSLPTKDKDNKPEPNKSEEPIKNPQADS